MNRVQIKICGMTRVEDAKMCAESGADMIGLNFYRQSPRYLEPSVGRQIVEATPASVCAVGVFVDASADEVRKIASIVDLGCVQLHGDV
jgi:phosphoribosylanthranilate isomerase